MDLHKVSHEIKALYDSIIVRQDWLPCGLYSSAAGW